jgi:hypothetical protein
MLRYRATLYLYRVSFVVISIICTAAAMAHDSFLIAEKNRAESGETVRFAFISSDAFPTGDAAPAPARVKYWLVLDDGERRGIDRYAVEGQELVSRVTFERRGMHVVAVALHEHPIELDAETFEKYLREEEAAAALEWRRRHKLEQQPGREFYTKLAKTFVAVGEGVGDAWRRPVGHALEIVPLSDPARWSPGENVTVRVLLRGQPAVGLRVSSGREGLPPHTYVENVRTDEEGVARLRLDREGLWFIRTHVIEPVSGKPDRDWESLWASFTFRVAGDERENRAEDSPARIEYKR